MRTQTFANAGYEYSRAVEARARRREAGFSALALAGALALLALAGSARAQITNGTVNFCNNRSSRVVFLQATNPVAASNSIQAALYWAPVGSNNFVKLGAAVPVGVPLSGLFAGGTRVAGPGTPGGAAGQFQVRAWGGPYSSYEQAFTNGPYYSGVSDIITLVTGNPTNAAPTPPASLVAGGFQGFGLGQAPVIIVPPTNQTVGIGWTAVFTVTATGATPLSYQWQFNGTNLTDSAHIIGSLTPALTILNAQPNDAGSYRVVVSNPYGVTTSPSAVLTVVRECVPPPSGLIGWWKGDGNGVDSAGGNNAYAIQNVTFTNGIVGQAFACDPENQPYGTYTGVRVKDIPAYVLTNSLTIEGWVRVRGGAYCVFLRGDDRSGYDPYGMGTDANNVMGFTITDANGNYAGVSTPLVYGQWYHVAGTLDDASGNLTLYTNGTIAAQITTTIRPLGELLPDRSPGLGIGNVNDDFNNFPFWGDIDEISLYNRALTAGEIQNIYNAYNAGKCLAAPPVITVPPTNQIVVVGSNAVFSVLAGGSPTLGYQWWFNGTSILAATTATLTITNAQATNTGSYQVVVTNAYGSATSPVATLIVVFPPQIIVQPTNQTVWLGSNATFSVVATGTAPLSYQWQFNGTNLSDGTHITGSHTNVLTILGAQPRDAGSYRVVVTNLYGMAVSSNAVLKLIRPCMPPPAGLIGWWKGENNGVDSAAGNNAYALQNIGFTAGIVGQAFSNAPYGYPPGTYNGVRIADQPAYALTNSLTIEGWIRVHGGYNVFWRGDTRPGYDPYILSTLGIMGIGFQITDATGNYAAISTPLVSNQWYHVAATLDGDSGKMSIYTNGVLAVQTNTAMRPFGDLIPSQSPGIGIANVNDAFNNFPFWGDIDEISLYNRALSPGEIQGIYNAYDAGKCLASPPVITVPPTNQIVFGGSNAVFSVLAGGSPALAYQWIFNGTNTLAATTAALTIPNAQTNNAGSYQVIVTNAYGSATSSVATLTVVFPPQIIVQPTSQIVLLGSNAVFSVTATGTPPLAYQWQFNGTNLTDGPHITGSLTTVLTILGVQMADAGSYRVIVTNLYGTAFSSNAMLTPVRACMPPPAGLIGWWKGEGNGVDSAGGNNAYAVQNVGFTPGIVGQAFSNSPYSYPYGTYNGVRIADQPAYALTNSLSIEGWIRVRGGYTVFWRGDSRPGFDPYELNTLGNMGISFMIADGSGNYALAYTPLVSNQWYHVAATLDGDSGKMSLYTNATLAAQITTTVRPFGPLAAGQSPGIGIANLNDAYNNFPFSGDIDEISLYNRALIPGEIQGIYNAYDAGKCLAAAPVITVPPTNQVVAVGSTALLSVLAGGSPALGYQWIFNGTNTLAATTARLTIPNAQFANAGSYYVVVTNSYGQATSPTAYLSVVLPPRFLSVNVRTGLLTMTWNGAAGFSYQLQYKTNLTQLYWSNLGSIILATSNIVTGYDLIGPDRQRFYRVALLP